MEITSNSNQSYTIDTIVLDLNGTLSVKGEVSETTRTKLSQLTDAGIKVVFFTGDQRGTAADLASELGIEFQRAKTAEDKERLMLELNPETTAAIGNARIDIGTFKHAKLSIATIQSEGIHAKVLQHVDILVTSIEDALDLFIDTNSLSATLKS